MSDLDSLMQLVLGRTAAMALYARQWTRDASEAEDVVQEALVSLLAQRPPPERPVAWMYRAVRNGAIDQGRMRSRRRRRERAVAEARREWFESRADSLIDARVAEESLRLLPDEQREIVVLRIWGQLGFAEIAGIVRSSISTVHERYVSALARLRAALEKPCNTSMNLKRAD
jgi:RNA polymerase sigma-70 factor (ECF subfamily)